MHIREILIFYASMQPLSSFNDHETTLAFQFWCFFLLCLYCGNDWYSAFVVSVSENRREGTMDNCHIACVKQYCSDFES